VLLDHELEGKCRAMRRGVAKLVDFAANSGLLASKPVTAGAGALPKWSRPAPQQTEGLRAQLRLFRNNHRNGGDTC